MVKDNIVKYNASFIRNYTETSFGYYTHDSSRPDYYDGNMIAIEKDCSEVYDLFKQHVFRNIIASKSWFEKHGLTYETEELCVMKSGQYDASEEFDNCIIKLLDDTLFDEYYKFCEINQVNQYQQFFNPPSKDILLEEKFKVYLIIHDHDIIGTFEVYDDIVFENVGLDPKYRNRGIMRNYLNYIAKDKTMYLICGGDVVSFYEKSGFVEVKRNVQYSKLIDEKFEISFENA